MSGDGRDAAAAQLELARDLEGSGHAAPAVVSEPAGTSPVVVTEAPLI